MTLTALFFYLLAINAIALCAYGIDKYKAKNNKWRISEKLLIILAVVGGSVGAIWGMKLFHHKTLHKRFYIGVPTILLLQIAAAVFCIIKYQIW